jgi:hypothetical protein
LEVSEGVGLSAELFELCFSAATDDGWLAETASLQNVPIGSWYQRDVKFRAKSGGGQIALGIVIAHERHPVPPGTRSRRVVGVTNFVGRFDQPVIA